MAVPAGHVVDEVAERLRDGRTGVRGEERVQIGRGLSGVQRAAYGARREPVDRRPALRLDVREDGQRVGEGAFQRAGRDGGQVGLEQDVVEGLRESGASSAAAFAGAGVEQGAGLGRRARRGR